jgi:antitoxin CptB
MREVDLLLGPFADAHIADLEDHDLADFEALMEVPDDELLSWIVGRAPVAPNYRSRVFDSIVAFHARAHDQS